MRHIGWAAALAVLGCGASISVSAGVIVDDGFEYATQGAFEAAWPAVAGVTSAALDPDRFRRGAKSVSTPAVATINQFRNGRSFDEIGVPSPENAVAWGFDFYDSNADIDPYRAYATLQDGANGTSSGQLVSVGLNSNLQSPAGGGNFYMARILGYNGGSYFKLNDGGPDTLRTTGWHHLRVVIDDQCFRFYVDGTLAETVSQIGTGSGGANLTLRSYDVIRIGSGLSSAADAGFDNMFLATTPEPGPALAAAAGLLGLLGRPRRDAPRAN